MTLPIYALVLETFKGGLPSGHEVIHLDGNRKNNSPENLATLDSALLPYLEKRFGPEGGRKGKRRLSGVDRDLLFVLAWGAYNSKRRSRARDRKRADEKDRVPTQASLAEYFGVTQAYVCQLTRKLHSPTRKRRGSCT